MRNTKLMLVPFVLLAACTERAVSPVARLTGPNLQAVQGGVVHRVSVGGPDICPAYGEHPGCDGNLSLIALESVDGSVSGQWEDASPDAGNLHAVPDCIDISRITLPNGISFLQAWIGGVITGPESGSLVGHRVITRVRDRGTSANDPPDVLSFSLPDPELHGVSSNCHDRPPMGLVRVPQGQVKIW